MAPLAARGSSIKPLNELTATEIIAAIGQGQTTCEAVAHACLERIAAREPQVHAYLHAVVATDFGPVIHELVLVFILDQRAVAARRVQPVAKIG